MPTLVLLRHGQSQWNLENRFTGWVDVDLTAEGEAQAKKGGELIKDAGIQIDAAHGSFDNDVDVMGATLRRILGGELLARVDDLRGF